MTTPDDPCVREAQLYRKAGDSTVDCFLCAHRCHIRPGGIGLCRVRRNREGTLHTLVYGRLISANTDPIEKKPLYHFLPGTSSYSVATAGCNFKCEFCQNADISQVVDPEHLPGRYVKPEHVVADALRRGCASIAYTYTEPTVFFEFARDAAAIAHENGLKNVFVTNGYQTSETIDAMAGLIDAANVDLKSFSDDFYRRLCKARLQPVLDSIRAMYERGIFLEVTTLLIPGENDSDAEIRRISQFLADISPDIPWHVSAFYPAYHMRDKPRTTPGAIHRALEIGKEAGIRFRYAGNIPGSESENTFCPACGEPVIARTGFFVRKVNLDGSRCGNCGEKLPIVPAD